MTIICYRDGIMASDTVTFAGATKVGSLTKIVRGKIDGENGIAGASGLTSCCQHFNEWFSAGCQSPFEPKYVGEAGFWATIVLSGGSIWHMNQSARRFQVFAEFIADGSGQDFALGAMAAGASAEDAVRIAIELDAYCAGHVTSLRLRED